MKNSNILDVTLRDGSYAVDFQFSALDTETIGKKLEAAGIGYIEIGHGMGVGKKSPEQGISLSRDEEYLEAAQKNYGTAQYGVFCIPGIATLDDVRMVKSRGASFIRVGTNISDVKESGPYIRLAKELELTVMANYMKSYTASEKEFAECVKLSCEYGADVIYVVDSAGCMQPEDIKKYYHVIKDTAEVKSGFHGHDNLGLALWNSLYAEELGFDFIDTSLQGLGRSSGNASTELFVANMMRRSNSVQYDCKQLVNAGDAYIRPLLKRRGLSGLDIYCGISGFHTSYMKYIQKCVAKYSVNPYELILKYCSRDQVNMNEKLLEEIARSLPKEEINMSKFGFSDYIGNEQKG